MRIAVMLGVWVTFGGASVASAQTYLHGSTARVSSCTGMYYDSGGAAGVHSDSESSTMTFCDPGGGSITLSFSSLNLESCCDSLTLYDGMDTTGALIGSYTGMTSPGVVTSTSSCLTAEFYSDSSVTYDGWAATISCGGPVLRENGETCSAASVCASGYCVGGVCCESECDDGLVCNGTETCATGACFPAEPLDCDDFDGCTADTCVEGIGCRSEPIPGCGDFDAGPRPDGGRPRDAGPSVDGGSPPADSGTRTGGRRRSRGCAVAGESHHDFSGLFVMGFAISLALARRRRRCE